MSPLRRLPAEPGQDGAMARALVWHSASPIHLDQPGSPAHGAVLHGLDAISGKPLGFYTEITGYAVSLYLFLRRSTGDSRFLDAARKAADYLLRIQTSEGAYPDLPDPTDQAAPPRLFAFDTAMCLVGMARLSRATGDHQYRQSAARAGDWLLNLQRPDGSFVAMLPSGAGIQDPGIFFGDGSCIHAKNAIALLELYGLIGGEKLREAAVRVCEHTVTLQAPDGGFWSRPSRRGVFTHAHCYACEGLFYAGTVLREDRFLAAARQGVEWLARNQRSDGGWFSRYKTSAISTRWMLDALQRPQPTDAAAQAARLFRLAGAEFDDRRRAAIRFLVQCQDPGGGFPHLRTRLGRSPFLYTWCAQFAIQALAWNTGPAAAEDLF